MTITISGVPIGVGNPCRLVAEIGNSHSGDKARALKLIKAAKDNGADFVKFQTYSPDELVKLRGDGPAPAPWGNPDYDPEDPLSDPGMMMRELYEQAQTPFEWFPDLVAYCEEVEIPWFSSVFGAESLELLESLSCPAYKVAALDEHHRGLFRAIRMTNKPVIASKAHGYAKHADLTLYCPRGYPQTDIDMSRVRTGYNLGFSYHGMRFSMPLVAALLGAPMVEFHFHLKAQPSTLEANVCLNQSDLKELAECVQHANASALS